MHASTSSGARPAVSVRRTASSRNGNSSRLTTKPAESGTSTGRFSSCSRQRERAGARVGVGDGRERELHERHPRHRVEHVEAEVALRAAAGPGERVHGQARGGRGQHGVGVQAAAELGGDRPLGLEVLGDRLDREAEVTDGAEVGGHRSPGRPRRRPRASGTRGARRARRARPRRPSAPTWSTWPRRAAVAARPQAIVPLPMTARRSSVWASALIVVCRHRIGGGR